MDFLWVLNKLICKFMSVNFMKTFSRVLLNHRKPYNSTYMHKLKSNSCRILQYISKAITSASSYEQQYHISSVELCQNLYFIRLLHPVTQSLRTSSILNRLSAIVINHMAMSPDNIYRNIVIWNGNVIQRLSHVYKNMKCNDDAGLSKIKMALHNGNQ